MEEQKAEKQKVQAAPSATEPKVEGKKSKKTLLIIIIVVVASFCFLSSAAATAGVVYWKKQQDKEDSSTSSGQDQNNGDDADGDDQNDGQDGDGDDDADGDDDSDGSDDGGDNDGDDGDGDTSGMPSLEDIYTAMDGLDTYSMTITSSETVELGDIYAEYEAPDKIRIEITIGGIRYESISIGDEVYTKQGDGPWTEMDLGYTELSEDFMDMLSDEDYIFLPSGQKDGHWYYEVTYEGTTGGMYVMKSTNYVKKIEVIDEEAGDIIIVFGDFNSDEIDIQKPI